MNSNTTFVKAEDKWVDEHPSGWTIKRADFVVFSHRKQISPEDMEGQIVYHYSIPAIQKTGTGAIEEGDDLDSGKLVIDQPQVLVSKLNPRKGTVCLVDQSEDMLTIASTEFVPLIPKNANLQYVFYVWKSEKIIKRLSSFVQSVTKSHQRCQPSDILKIKWAWPDLDTQEAIVNFLDEKTAHIDALIVKKRELLKLLAENRAAIITHAVTKGINPDAPMKDSGIDWLDQIPEHWGIRRLKDVGKLVGGAGFPHDQQGLESEELPFYKVGDLVASSDGITMGKPPNTISYKTAKSLRASIVPTGSILYAKIGAALLLNRRRISAAICCIDNNMTAYVPKTSMSQTKWAYYWLCILNFKEFMNPGAVPSFSEGYQSTLPITLPPASEQKCIANFLDEKTAHIDALIEKNRKLLELLTEMRSAIITNAVTGKIKVT